MATSPKHNDDAIQLDEIDTALRHARATHPEQRTEKWHEFVDGLLDQRRAIDPNTTTSRG